MIIMIIIMTRASSRGRHICRRIPSRKCCRHFWSQVASLNYKTKGRQLDIWIEISHSVLHLSINPKILIFRSLEQFHVILPADTSSTTTKSMLIFCGRCCNVFNFHFSYLSLSLDYIFFRIFSRIWMNNSSNNSLFKKTQGSALFSDGVANSLLSYFLFFSQVLLSNHYAYPLWKFCSLSFLNLYFLFPCSPLYF